MKPAPTLKADVPYQGIGIGLAPKDTSDFDVTSWLFTMIAFGLDNNALGGGGSAMPCGLVLPAASAQLELADLLPDVRPAALSY